MPHVESLTHTSCDGNGAVDERDTQSTRPHCSSTYYPCKTWRVREPRGVRGASVVERCARAVAYHIARATATAEQGQQARSWFSTCSQCCADDRCSSRPPTCGRSTSTVLVRGTSQRHPPSLLPYRYSPGCWMPLAHPHCDGCRSTPASLTTTEVPGRAQNRARLLGTGAEEAQSAADRTHVRCPPLTGTCC